MSVASRISKVLMGMALLMGLSCKPSARSPQYGHLTATPSLASKLLRSSNRTWHRYTSKNIELLSDYSQAQAIEAVHVFERAKVFLDQVLPYKAPEQEGPLLVILFQDPQEIRSRSNNPLAVCTFMVQAPGALHRRPMILAAGDDTQSMRLHWVHELTHYELYRRYGALPAWLDEGLASYFSSIEDRGDHVLLGTPQRLWRFVDDDRGMRVKKEWTHKRTVVPRTWFLDASDLVRTDYYEFHPSMGVSDPSQTDMENEVINYAESWLVIHMLYHGHPEYRQLLRDSIATQPDPLKWGKELVTRLHEIPHDTLDRNVSSYATALSNPAQPIAMPILPPAKVHIESLSPTQVVETKAMGLAKPELLLPDLEALLFASPPSAQALRTRAWMLLRRERHSDAAYALCAAHKLLSDSAQPDQDELAEVLHLGLWIDVALRNKGKALGCLPDRAVHGTAWAYALRKVARTGAQWHAVTQVLGAYGEYKDAVRSGERALTTDPSCWACYESMAQLSHRLGQPHRALALQHSAIDWTPSALGERYLSRQRHDLTRYSHSAKPK